MRKQREKWPTDKIVLAVLGGPLSVAEAARLTYSWTVLRATLTLRPASWSLRPRSNLRRRTSRMFRMAARLLVILQDECGVSCAGLSRPEGQPGVPDNFKIGCRVRLESCASYWGNTHELQILDDVDHQQVISTAHCNNLIDQSHRPTRCQERSQLGFRQVKRAQGFLDLHARIIDLHGPTCSTLPAHDRRHALAISLKLESRREAGGLNFRPPAGGAPQPTLVDNDLPGPRHCR